MIIPPKAGYTAHQPVKPLRRLVRVRDAALIDVSELSACMRTTAQDVMFRQIHAVTFVMRSGHAIAVPMDETKTFEEQGRDALSIIDIVETVWRKAIEEAGS